MSGYEIFKKHWDTGKMEFLEEFKIILLNGASRVIGIVDIALGGTSVVPVDVSIIFATALKANASSMILAHNHPSGTMLPSGADVMITDKICRAGKLLDIRVHDHLIVTPEGYYSFADEGLIPDE